VPVFHGFQHNRWFHARPHPGLLPRGEGETLAAFFENTSDGIGQTIIRKTETSDGDSLSWGTTFREANVSYGETNCGGLGKPLGQGEGEPNDIFPQKSVALAPDRLIIACAFGKGIVRDIFQNNAAKLARMVTPTR